MKYSSYTEIGDDFKQAELIWGDKMIDQFFLSASTGLMLAASPLPPQNGVLMMMSDSDTLSPSTSLSTSLTD